MIYIFNVETDLYYAVTSTIEPETGLVTLSVSQDGVEVDPGYVPSEGESLCPIEYYLMLFKITEASLDGNRYSQISQAVSRYVERYTCNSWVDITVPSDLLYTVAHMIRDKFNESDKNKDPRFQSESVKNYSYTINGQSLMTSIMAKYNDDLNMFRIIPFA